MTHLQRTATVYLRQSTMRQVHEHRESTTRQYGLRDRALSLGWKHTQIDVIDDDLGQSGSTNARDGFQRLAEDVAHGRVGAIFSLEVSRLARSSADWHQLLDLCGLADVVIVDEQAVYSPLDYNDRLLLGLKGTMSEAELYWMRLRLHGGQVSKARRGEYAFLPPAGYEWDAATSRFRMDPDENVQRAIRLVFERFRLDGSAYAVARYFNRHGLELPARSAVGGVLAWGPPRQTLIVSMLHNPIYAGAYAWGRVERRIGLVDGKKRYRQRKLPQQEWKVCLQDRHAGYITWDELMANKDKLRQNRTSDPEARGRGAAREGSALLQGLVLCGRCGRRMHVQYCGDSGRAIYQCRDVANVGQCYVVPAKAVDDAVARLFLETVKPPEIELGLAVVHEAERQAGEVDRQWKLRIEQAQYEARLCERRYKAVDPDNRVVARTLEREWNDKLETVERLELERDEVRRREKIEITPADRARILELSKNLSAVWQACSTTHADRKNLLRMLVSEVTASRVDVPHPMTRVQVLWKTGAVSDFTIDRRTRFDARATLKQAVSLIEQSFRTQGDQWIADRLNQRKLRTGAGRPWTPDGVRRVRLQHQWFRRPRKQREATAPDDDGLYSAHAVAARLGIKTQTVLGWVRSGLLTPVHKGSRGRPYRFQLDDDTLQRLRVQKQEFDQRRASASGASATGSAT
ncbi:MAG TPA: recombinase family protein [Polyangiaceae bacterium]|nr:recombinase family protein [Polyangiaceae bacterium]